MFLEVVGRLFFSKMRPLFFFLFALFPLIGASLYLSSISFKLRDLEERFASAAKKERLAFSRKERKEKFLQRFSRANPYFLDEKIESFPLLEKERKKIEALLHHPAFPESESLQERLLFIKENRLAFREEKIASSSQLKEVEEKQLFAVQMDESDLKCILSLIEDVPIDGYLPIYQNNLKNRECDKETSQNLDSERAALAKGASEDPDFEGKPAQSKTASSSCFGISNAPQILIKDFRLKKQQIPFHSEVFEVEMDLIKRDFFHE